MCILQHFSEMYLQSEKKTVEVAEYVLPRFDVIIDSPAHFSAKNGKIRAIIRSKYTYGKFVKGDTIISIAPKRTYYGYFSSSQPKDVSAIIKRIKIDGKGTAEFGIEDDIGAQFNEYQSSLDYELKATVIEELTGDLFRINTIFIFGL